MSFLIKYYDKLIAATALLGVAAAAAFLFLGNGAREAEGSDFSGELRSLRPKNPEVAPFAMDPYETAEALLENPPQITLPARGEPGFFATDLRVWCPDCKKPIPEKLDKCSACGFDQIIKEPDDGYPIYGDKCPIKWGWAKKYGMDLTYMGNAPWELVPGKEWTWLEMFEYNKDKDPRDKDNNPPFERKLRLAHIESKPIGLAFTVKNKMGETYSCTVEDNDRRSYNVRPTEDASKKSFGDENFLKDHGYKAVALEVLSERRMNPAIGREQDMDVSKLTLLRVSDNTRIVLVFGQRDAAEEFASIEMPPDKLTFDVAKGSTFTLRGTEFLVTVIDSKKQSVTVENKSTKKKTTLSK